MDGSEVVKMSRLTLALVVVLSLVWVAVAAATTSSRLLATVRAEVPGFMQTWERLVNVDSGTGDAAGLAKIEAILVQRLNELGAEVQTVPAHPSAGDCIVGTFNGTGIKRILLMIHYDTVFQKGEAARRPFRVDGNQAFGPGVADAKGGVALILHAIALLREVGFSGYGTLTVLFNPDEEESSIGSRDLIRVLAAKQDYVLSYEPPDRDVVAVATNGIARVHLTVRGVASHAGSAPEKGRNAAMELAHQLLQLDRLGDPTKGTTVNWTVVRAGERVNIIPDEARATADMRLSDASELQRVQRQAEAMVQNHRVPGTTVTVKVEDRRPPLARNPGSEELAEMATRIYRAIGRSLEPAAMRFGTDAGFAYDPASDKPAVLETMGIVGRRIHTADEYAKIDSIVSRLYLTVRMVQELSGGTKEDK
jgi:glutamate carboxypeptidase